LHHALTVCARVAISVIQRWEWQNARKTSMTRSTSSASVRAR
jgi:hypothetical protein